MTSTISSLGAFLVQNENLNSLRTDLFTLQKQISTGKKSSTYAGLDTRVLDLLSARGDLSKTETYTRNIDIVSSRVEVMNTNLTEISEFANELRDTLMSLPREASDPDLTDIHALISSNFSFIEQLMNTEINGHYLFSGSASNVEPIETLSTVRNNTQNEIDAWFNGSQSYDQTLANVQALSDDELGYSSELANAQKITARIDDGLDIDYTVTANESGFQDLLKVMGFLENLEYPDPNDPSIFATETEFYQALDDFSDILYGAVQNIEKSQVRLSYAHSTINNTKERLNEESIFLSEIVSNIEDVDITEAITKLQQVELQLNASYQTISKTSELSLVNFI